MLNINNENGADVILLGYAARCMQEFDGPLHGAELGVAYGGGIEAVGKLWRGRGIVYGFDTFEGHPTHLSADPNAMGATCMQRIYDVHGYDRLSDRYQREQLDAQGLSNVLLVKGLVHPHCCDPLPLLHYALLDLDIVESMRAGYEALRDHMVPGGYLCIHDYIDTIPETTRWYDENVRHDPRWILEREYRPSYLAVLKRKG